MQNERKAVRDAEKTAKANKITKLIKHTETKQKKICQENEQKTLKKEEIANKCKKIPRKQDRGMATAEEAAQT